MSRSSQGDGDEDGQGGAGRGGAGQQTSGATNANAGTPAAAGGGTETPLEPSKGGTRLRLLTRAEYENAVSDLLGTINTPLVLPSDVNVAGFISVGASEVAVSAAAASLYETASLAATAEVFADTTRWHTLVGCQPQPDLSDACVASFIQSAGKRAYRRPLTDGELAQWLRVGRDAALLPGSTAAQGLAAVTSGLLQSLNFLYRAETNQLDETSGRLKYDGASMATRLAFLLTGRPPSDALLDAAAAGQLDTADGVREAAAPLLAAPNVVDQMAQFFSELSQAELVSVAIKSPELFPSFGPPLQSSMLEATQLFIKNIVLAPGADVRTFFDSDQTFVDTALAAIYGVAPPTSGFAQLTLASEQGRAGILGQAAVLTAQSRPDHNSPTRRGVFILQNLLCQSPEPPPAGVPTDLPTIDQNMTTRQKMEKLTSGATCNECHSVFDPLGFALEHFDPIGRYRATEEGLPIDASGVLDGVRFDGAAELGTVLAQSPRALTCMVNNYYRNANARMDAAADSAQIDALTQTLSAKRYVWRDLVAEFVTSDAFRSAPAVADKAGDP